MAIPCEIGRLNPQTLHRRLATIQPAEAINDLAEGFSASEQAAPNFVLTSIEAIELLAHRNTTLDLYAIYGAKVQPPQDEVAKLISTIRKGGLHSHL